MGEDGVVRAPSGILSQCSKKITAVEAQGGDMIRMGGDFIDE